MWKGIRVTRSPHTFSCLDPDVLTDRRNGGLISMTFASPRLGGDKLFPMSEPLKNKGFDYKFHPSLEPKHRCPVCRFALRDPFQTACGHRFCGPCLKDVLGTDKPRCPIDNEILRGDETFPDNFCKREVLSLLVRCDNQTNGCPWCGALKNVESHQNDCLFQIVVCPNEGCSLSIKRRDFDEHLEKECDFRTLACSLCGQLVTLGAQAEHDAEVCPEATLECPNGCGERIRRKKLSEHKRTECSNAKLSCKYPGCTVEGSQKAMEDHYQSSKYLDFHLSLLKDKVEETSLSTYSPTTSRTHGEASSATATASSRSYQPLPSQTPQLSIDIANVISLLQKQVEELQSKIAGVDSLTRQVEDLSSGLSSKDEIIRQLSADNATLRREVSTCHAKLSALEQKQVANQTKAAANEHKIISLERSSSIKENIMAEHDVRLLSLEMAAYDGILRWKITEFQRRQSEARAGKRLSIYSPPFYTARTGYKMCARVYLNGDGMGKGSHLSLFFVIMKGEYDALLPWPFQQRVTFTLINQEHQNHISDNFQPDPSSTSFRRPVSEMNVASGCPLFVPLDDLSKRGYVNDDTIFIRVEVSTERLRHP
eukprot:m.209113 g.209113  ORF g.209113 m.209113 type:complete len:596 (+) comp39725_c1_seq29:2949-4736(+)